MICSKAPTEWETRTLTSVSVSKILFRTKTGSWGGISILTTVCISSQENNKELNRILLREKRMKLYNDCLKFVKTRVDLDLASFKDDIWSH